MSRKSLNFLGLGVMALLVVLFEIGAMSSANALFSVLTILIALTTVHFMAYEGQGLSDAVRSMLAWPKLGNGRVLSHLAYFGCSIAGVLVVVQAVTTA